MTQASAPDSAAAVKPTERDLWQAYLSACAAYERDSSVDNWMKKTSAHRAWQIVFLGGEGA